MRLLLKNIYEEIKLKKCLTFSIQDFCLIIALTVLLATFFSTYIFQVSKKFTSLYLIF